MVLYLTILVGDAAYTGILVGDNELPMGSLMGISISVTLIIAITLVILFWLLFVKVK